MFIFTDQVKDIASIKGAEFIRKYLSIYLRDTALEWYNSELSTLKKTNFKYAREGRDDSGVDLWIEILTNRFKETPSVALEKLKIE